MLWAWDSYRSRGSDRRRPRIDQDRALSRFAETVDLLFYAAAALLAACVLGLIIG